MNTTTQSTRTWRIGKTLGVLFVGLCLVAIILNIALPIGSRAAASEIRLTPIADTHVKSSDPDGNFGTVARIAVDATPQIRSLIRFAVTDVGQNSISQARLRLFVVDTNPVADLKVFRTDDNWDEVTVTWNKQPPLGPQVAELAPVPMKLGSWLEVNLGQAITGDGVYTFALTTSSNDRATFGSRTQPEAPQLVLMLNTTTGPATPTAVAAPTATATPTSQQPTMASTAARPGYLVSLAELQQRKRLADQGVQPHSSAVRDLLTFANGQLSAAPSPIEPLDIPGSTGPFVDDARNVYGLALAYGLTGDVKYAAKAREIIMAWVNTTKTTLNTCPNSGACQTSLVIGRNAPGFVFAADLIKPAGVFSAEDDQAFRTWLRTVILPTASLRDSNWGDAGVFMRITITDYLGDQAGFDAAISDWKRRIDLIADDGHIPAEVARDTSGINYTQGALTHKIAVAVIAEHRGVDLWSYGRFKLAIDYVAPYVLNPAVWPWATGATATPYPLWELAYAHWHASAYQPLASQRRPFGANFSSALRWATLTNGITFQ
jgi:hypothetical protein